MDFSMAVDLIEAHRKRGNVEHEVWKRHTEWYNAKFARSETGRRSPSFERPVAPVEAVEESSEQAGFETNYPFAFIDSMIANVVPSKPGVRVTPRKQELWEAAAARDALANDTFRHNKLNTQLWRGAAWAGVCGRAFLRVGWNPEKGVATLRAIHPQRVYFDTRADDWDDIRYLITWADLTEAEFKARAGKQIKGSQTYIWTPSVVADALKTASPGPLLGEMIETQITPMTTTSDPEKVFKFIRLYEVYDFTAGADVVCMQLVMGCKAPLYKSPVFPFEGMKNPFFMLYFNENLIDLSGVSDVSLIEGSLVHLNTLDTLEIWHAMSSIPKTLVDSSVVANAQELVTALATPSAPNDIVLVEMLNKTPMQNGVWSTPVAQLSMSVAGMRSRAAETIEFTLGLPQFSRGGLGAEVATEVALADAALRTRNGRRQRMIFDAIEWAARCSVAIYAQKMATSQEIYAIGRDNVKAVVNRELALFDNADVHQGMFDYEVVPGVGTESQRVAKQRDIVATFAIWQWAIEKGLVNPAAFMREFAATQELAHLVTGEGLPPAPPAAEGAMPGAGPVAPAPEDPPGQLPGVLPTSDFQLPPGMAGGAGNPNPVGNGTTPSGVALAKNTENVQTGPYVPEI